MRSRFSRPSAFWVVPSLLLAAAAAGAEDAAAPPEGSDCRDRLESAREEIGALREENRALRERLAVAERLLHQCRAAREGCHQRLRNLRKGLHACRVDLGRCTEDLFGCREKARACGEALGTCREELAGCQDAPCCDPLEEPGTHGNPFCFEGATCCADGTWQCNRGDATPTCDAPGRVCGLPPPCVDPETGAVRCCIRDGIRHAIGESFPAGDGCNVCACLETGQVVCTLRPCVLEAP